MIKAAIARDRYAWFKNFFDNFYNTDKLMPERISEQAWQASFNVAAGASPFASYACVDTWLTDFRGDLAKIDVPVLVVHGTDDRILPFEATAARLPDLIDDVKLVAVEGGPHNIAWTHPDYPFDDFPVVLSVANGGSVAHLFRVTVGASRLALRDLIPFPNPFDNRGLNFSFTLLGTENADVKVHVSHARARGHPRVRGPRLVE